MILRDELIKFVEFVQQDESSPNWIAEIDVDNYLQSKAEKEEPEEPPTEPIEPCQTHHWMYRGERLDGRFVCERCGATQ